MKKNVGSVDRLIRAIVGLAALAFAYFEGHLGGAPAWLTYGSAIVGAILVLSALIGHCPLYGVCGICSRKEK